MKYPMLRRFKVYETVCYEFAENIYEDRYEIIGIDGCWFTIIQIGVNGASSFQVHENNVGKVNEISDFLRWLKQEKVDSKRQREIHEICNSTKGIVQLLKTVGSKEVVSLLIYPNYRITESFLKKYSVNTLELFFIASVYDMYYLKNTDYFDSYLQAIIDHYNEYLYIESCNDELVVSKKREEKIIEMEIFFKIGRYFQEFDAFFSAQARLEKYNLKFIYSSLCISPTEDIIQIRNSSSTIGDNVDLDQFSYDFSLVLNIFKEIADKAFDLLAKVNFPKEIAPE